MVGVPQKKSLFPSRFNVTNCAVFYRERRERLPPLPGLGWLGEGAGGDIKQMEKKKKNIKSPFFYILS